MKKRVLAVLLIGALALSLAACGSSSSEEVAADSGEVETEVAEETADEVEEVEEVAGDSYDLAYAELGEGVWAVDYYMLESQYLVEALGSSFTYTSSDFSADKMQSDIQSLLASGIDGLFYYGSFPTITQTVAEMCDEYEGVYFVMPDQLPYDEAADIVQSSESFAGAVGSDPYEVGYQLGSYAAANGGTKALILAGAEGDSAHDGRTNGFTAGFEDNGGEVLAVARVANMPDAAAAADDLLTANPKVDTWYGATADHGAFCLSSLDTAGRDDVMVYCTDSDNSSIEYIKDGKMIGDGGACVCTTIAACLLINALDGHMILDPDGNAAIFDECLNFIITPDNVDEFNEYWIEGHPLEASDYEQLLYRYNPDVDYNTFLEFVQNYSFESVAENK